MLVKNKNVNTFCLIHFYQSIKILLVFSFHFFCHIFTNEKTDPKRRPIIYSRTIINFFFEDKKKALKRPHSQRTRLRQLKSLHFLF